MQYAGQIEFTITEQAPDRVTAEMPIQAGILNPFGTVQRLVSYFPLTQKTFDCPLLKNGDWIRE